MSGREGGEEERGQENVVDVVFMMVAARGLRDVSGGTGVSYSVREVSREERGW